MISLSKNLWEKSKQLATNISTEIEKIKKVYNTSLSNIDKDVDSTNQELTQSIFCNFKPKIGFFDEDTVEINSDFQSNILSGAGYVITDNQGFENFYYTSYQSPRNTSTKMYRAYRTNVNSNFIYETNPILITINGSQQSFSQLFGVGNDYIFGKYDVGTSKSPLCLINTNYSSNPKDWKVIGTNLDSAISGWYLVFGLIYSSKYNTFCVVGEKTEGVIHFEKYALNSNVSGSPTLKSSCDLLDIKQVITNQNTDMYKVSGWNMGHRGVTWDGKQHLLINFCFILYWKENGVSKSSYQYIVIPCDMIEAQMKSDSSFPTLKPTTTNAKFKRDADYCTKGNISETQLCGFTYDSLSNKYYFCHRIHASGQMDLYSKPFSTTYKGNFYYDAATCLTHIEPNDAAPWSKNFRAPIVVEGATYFYGMSKKHGWISFYANFDFVKSGTNCVADWNSNGWYKFGEHGDVSLGNTATSQLKSGTTTQTFYVQNNKPYLVTLKNVTENGVTYKNVRTLVDNSYPTAPTFSVANVTRRTNPYYFPNLFVWMGQMLNSTVGGNVPVIVTYDVTTKTWKVYDSISDHIKSEATIAKNSMGTANTTFHLETNFFKEGNDLFFRFAVNVDSSMRGWTMTSLNLATGVYTQHTKLSLNVWAGNATSIGWNNTYHYYATNHNSSSALTEVNIYSSRKPTGDGDYGGDFKQMLDTKNCYNTIFYCEPASNLSAYINETPIFLGGYYSVLPVTEISLKPNADNYVFLQRNSEDNTKIDVFVTTNKQSIPDNNFSSICIAKIATNNRTPIKTEYYHINNYN